MQASHGGTADGGTRRSRREFLALASAAAGAPLLATAGTPAAASAAIPVAANRARGGAMGTVTVGRENSTPIEIYYEDFGSGRPVVLLHGWPLTSTAWEKQVPALLAAGHRVVNFDMRGFGRSSQPSTGYDFDTLADDLHALMTALDLRDVALVGHSLGTGEVATYIGKHGTERLRKTVLISALPFFLRTADNPDGVDPGAVEATQRAIAKDRAAFLGGFWKDFYNTDVNLGTRISPEVIQGSWQTAYAASALATHAAPETWRTDLRPHLARFDVPTLVMHGTDDRILPIATTAVPTARAIRGARLVPVEGAPHGLTWTHGEEVNRTLLEFLA